MIHTKLTTPDILVRLDAFLSLLPLNRKERFFLCLNLREVCILTSELCCRAIHVFAYHQINQKTISKASDGERLQMEKVSYEVRRRPTRRGFSSSLLINIIDVPMDVYLNIGNCIAEQQSIFCTMLLTYFSWFGFLSIIRSPKHHALQLPLLFFWGLDQVRRRKKLSFRCF